MKRPIEWHENDLKTAMAYHAELYDAMISAIQNFERSSDEIKFMDMQIEEAKRQGKDGFDADKFLKKRGK